MQFNLICNNILKILNNKRIYKIFYILYINFIWIIKNIYITLKKKKKKKKSLLNLYGFSTMEVEVTSIIISGFALLVNGFPLHASPLNWYRPGSLNPMVMALPIQSLLPVYNFPKSVPAVAQVSTRLATLAFVPVFGISRYSGILPVVFT